MRFWLTVLAFLVSTSLSWGQNLVIEGDVKVVQVDKVITTVIKEDRTVVNSLPFTVKAPEGAGLYFWSYPQGVIATDMGDTLKVTIAPKGDMTISVKMITANVEGDKFKGFVTKFLSIPFVIGDIPTPVPPTPPTPPTPPDPPVPPTPVPVKSFRVVFAYESAKTLPAAQNSVIYGKKVRDWLTANTTPENGQAGWRTFDKDQNADKDSPTIKALWNAVQPKITTVPCVAVEVNGNVEIIPLEATQDAMIAVFEKYKAGR